MEKWLVYAKKADFAEQARKYQISPILARIIRNRNIIEDKEITHFLNGGIDDLYSPWLMKDMKKAVAIILDKITLGEKIRVIGDYDIDGICSSFILVDYLKKIGARVDLEIPDRITDGYGMNRNMIDEAHTYGIDTIITCDNGIAAIEEINYAKELGMTVIVTDHHNIPFTQEEGEIRYLESNADVIINPKQNSCEYPFKELCGAGVAYKLIEAISEKREGTRNQVQEYIEYVAIATIGDVVNLIGENRILVKHGLNLLNHTSNVGLKALIKMSNLEDKKIEAYHIGFILGPCLNSSGRLSTAKLAFALLSEESETEAIKIATSLKQLNDSRKELTNDAVKEAITMVDTTTLNEDKVLVIYLKECHESIAGIVAGRIREKYNKPTFILTRAEVGVKGSGRSIESYHMYNELMKCKELLLKFGGHPLAAGLSLLEENVERLRRQLNTNTEITQEDLQKKVWIDIALPFDYVDENLVNELTILEPFGMGNEKPIFAEKNVKVRKINILGKQKNVLKFELKNSSNKNITAIAFDNDEYYITYLTNKYGFEEVQKALKGQSNEINLSMLYYPQINEYNNYREVRILIKNII